MEIAKRSNYDDFVKGVLDAIDKCNANTKPVYSGDETDPDERINPKDFDYAEYKQLQESVKEEYGMTWNKKAGGYDSKPIKWNVDKKSGYCQHEVRLAQLAQDLENLAAMRRKFGEDHYNGKIDKGHQKQIDALNIWNVGVKK